MDMNLQKKEHLPQNTKPGKDCGQVGWAVGLFCILFLAVFLQALLQIEKYRMLSLYLEDALAASNLASAVMNVEEYGISHAILIDNPDSAYERYKWAVKENLNLDNTWRGQAGSLIQGPVSIENYTVYNVKENMIEIYQYDKNGLRRKWQEPFGGIAAPDGTVIEATSVYGEISFTVEGIFGLKTEARQGKLADIVR